MSRRQHVIRIRLALLAAAALLGAGCGSDPAPEASVTTPPTTSPATTALPAEDPPDEVAPTVAPSTAAPTNPAPVPPTPSTEAPSTEPPASTAPSDCVRLTDFDTDTNANWLVVNDGVMGGGSSGFVEFTESTMGFTGTVVTQGGGFTSVRLRLGGGELAGSTRVELRVRADQRTYSLTFGDGAAANGRRVAYGADLVMGTEVDAEGWTIATLSYDQLVATIFGQPVSADPFDAAEAQEIGIIIADGIDGSFALDVDWIDACR